MYWDPWSFFIPSRYLSDIDIDAEGKKWIGTDPVCGGGICTDGGLAVFDGYTWLVYDSLNSTLNSNYLGSVHIDADNVVWAGTMHGEVSAFDGAYWEAYPFPTNPNVPIHEISSDLYGHIWAATGGNGLFRYNGSDWEHHHSGNSILTNYLNSVTAGPDNAIWAGGAGNFIFQYSGDWNSYELPYDLYFTSTIGIDHEYRIWVGSDGIFCSFYEGAWTVFHQSITGIPDTCIGYVFDIEFDSNGNTWIGHSKGLIRYDGTDWTTFSPDNSGMLSEHVQSLAADELGNLWIGTADTGLIAYQEGGVVKIEDPGTVIEDRVILKHPYPNPSHNMVNIEYQLAASAQLDLSIIDIFGRCIRTLETSIKEKGSHRITWDGKNEEGHSCPQGIYFIQLRTEKQQLYQSIIHNP